MAVLINVVGKFNDKDLAKAQAALDALGKQAGGPTAKGFSRFGTAATSAIAGIGLTVFAKQSIDAFAQVQDAQSALQATYGDTGQAIIDFAERAGDALNLSKREALGAATTFANFGRAAGKTGQDLVSFTTPLIERAADAASYFGGTTADAVEAFGAALRGEMEPIRRYGVLLDDATLRAKAMEMGLISSTKNALTPQQKTLAAQALILEKTAQAQGDVARTSDSMANQIKDAQQQMDDFKTSTGETLSVAVGPLLKGLNAGIGTFNKLPQPVKSGAIAIGVLGAAAVIAGPKILMLRRELAATTLMAGKSGAAIKGVGAAFAAFAIASTAGQQLSKSVNSGTEDMAALLEQVGRTGQGMDKLGFQIQGITNGTYDFNDSVKRLDASGWDKFAQGFSHIFGQTDHLDLATEAVQNVDNALADMVKAGHADQAAMAVAKLRGEFQASGGDVNQFDAAMSKYHAAITSSIPPTSELTKQIDYSAAATKRLKTATEALQGVLDKRAALRAWKESLAGTSEAVKAAAGHFTAGTSKGRAFQDWLDSSIGSLSSYASGAKDAAGQSKRWTDGLGDLREKLSKMGLSKAEIDKILKPFRAMKGEAKKAGEETALGLAAGLEAKAQIAIARARALGKAAALAVKDGAEVKSPSRITIRVGEELVNGLTAGVLKKQGGAKKVIHDATRDALSAAQDALEKFHARGQTALDFINGIRANVVDSGAVTGFQAADGQPVTAAALSGSMRGRVQAAQQFAKDLTSLRKLGLNNQSLQEIIGAGPSAGGEIAKALLAGGLASVKEVNSLESQLNAAAASIGDTAGLSQYGLTGAQAKGLATASVKVEKGAIVIDARGATAKDARAIEDAVDKAVDKLVKKLLRELKA